MSARDELLGQVFEMIPHHLEADFERTIPPLLDDAIAEAVAQERERWVEALEAARLDNTYDTVEAYQAEVVRRMTGGE